MPKKSQKSIYTRNRMCYHTDNKNTDTQPNNKKEVQILKNCLNATPKK